MKKLNLIYTTFSSIDNAKSVIEQLLKAKLIACANINSNIQSIYEWEGKLCCEEEVSVILKTTTELVDEAMVQLKALHPYKVPCIIAIPVSATEDEFAEWITRTVK